MCQRSFGPTARSYVMGRNSCWYPSPPTKERCSQSTQQLTLRTMISQTHPGPIKDQRGKHIYSCSVDQSNTISLHIIFILPDLYNTTVVGLDFSL